MSGSVGHARLAPGDVVRQGRGRAAVGDLDQPVRRVVGVARPRPGGRRHLHRPPKSVSGRRGHVPCW